MRQPSWLRGVVVGAGDEARWTVGDRTRFAEGSSGWTVSPPRRPEGRLGTAIRGDTERDDVFRQGIEEVSPWLPTCSIRDRKGEAVWYSSTKGCHDAVACGDTMPAWRMTAEDRARVRENDRRAGLASTGPAAGPGNAGQPVRARGALHGMGRDRAGLPSHDPCNVERDRAGRERPDGGGGGKPLLPA